MRSAGDEARPDPSHPAPVELAAGAPTPIPADERREHRRRWLGLVVIAIAQLTIVVDATIINVALPAMTEDLHISEADRQWVLTGYTLAFGGFLLLGGRIADYVGLLRTFNIGLIGFGIASAIAGAAPNFQVLLVARAAQGLFGALMAPASMALLAVTFKDPKERGKAFAIFGAVAGGGSAIGLLLGGILTEYASWRWTMFINIPITLIAVAGGVVLLKEFRPAHPGRLDLVGTVLGTAGLLTIVYAFSEAERHGWAQNRTLFLLFLGVSLLIVFVLSQRMVANPVLPLRVLANRTRAGANLAVLLASTAMFGAFFWQTFFMQGVLGYSPVQTGVGFLAVTVGIIVSSAIVSSLVTKVSPRLIMGVGLLGASGAALLMVRINLESTYTKDLLPAMFLGGLSMGAVFVPAFNGATIGVEPRDASIASASINTGQQVGGSLGVALISTIAANRTADWMAGRSADPRTVMEGLVEGYVRASVWSAAILAIAAVVIFLLVNVKNLDLIHAGEFGAPPIYDELEPPAPQPAMAAAVVAAAGRTVDLGAVGSGARTGGVARIGAGARARRRTRGGARLGRRPRRLRRPASGGSLVGDVQRPRRPSRRRGSAPPRAPAGMGCRRWRPADLRAPRGCERRPCTQRPDPGVRRSRRPARRRGAHPARRRRSAPRPRLER